MQLSIILVNYKSAQYTLQCIESIYLHTHTTSFEIIVVDNFSEDETEKLLQQSFPEVVWHQMGYNAGFARANNAGIRLAQGEMVLLLNNDTVIEENALDKAVALMLQHTTAAATGVQLLNPDGSYQLSGAHFVKGGLNILLPLPYLGKFVRYWGYRLKTRVPGVTAVQDITEVDWIVGAFILTYTRIAKQSLLDEDFFMYAEEIEWCSRLKKYGQLYLFHEPRVIHFGGGSSTGFYSTTETENSKNFWNKKGRQILISLVLRIRKQYGLFWYFIITGLLLIEIPVFLLGLVIEKIFRNKKSRYTWHNFTDYCKNIFSLLKLMPAMIKNRPHFYKI